MRRNPIDFDSVQSPKLLSLPDPPNSTGLAEPVDIDSLHSPQLLSLAKRKLKHCQTELDYGFREASANLAHRFGKNLSLICDATIRKCKLWKRKAPPEPVIFEGSGKEKSLGDCNLSKSTGSAGARRFWRFRYGKESWGLQTVKINGLRRSPSFLKVHVRKRVLGTLVNFIGYIMQILPICLPNIIEKIIILLQR